jgi:hypothetical protein
VETSFQVLFEFVQEFSVKATLVISLCIKFVPFERSSDVGLLMTSFQFVLSAFYLSFFLSLHVIVMTFILGLFTECCNFSLCDPGLIY